MAQNTESPIAVWSLAGVFLGQLPAEARREAPEWLLQRLLQLLGFTAYPVLMPGEILGSNLTVLRAPPLNTAEQALIQQFVEATDKERLIEVYYRWRVGYTENREVFKTLLAVRPDLAETLRDQLSKTVRYDPSMVWYMDSNTGDELLRTLGEARTTEAQAKKLLQRCMPAIEQPGQAAAVQLALRRWPALLGELKGPRDLCLRLRMRAIRHLQETQRGDVEAGRCVGGSAPSRR